MSYDQWKLASPEDAGFYRDSDQERDDDVCAHCLSAPASVETEHGDAVCAACFQDDAAHAMAAE